MRKKLVMIISGRSGSSYLRTLLNQDNRVLMLGEMLSRKSDVEQKNILNDFFADQLGNKNKLIVGFKTKLKDVIHQDNFIKQINTGNPVILINRRKNYLKQAISRARMLILLEKTIQKYGKPHHSPRHEQDIIGQIEVDVDWIYEFTQKFAARDEQLEKLSQSLTNKAETIFYEDFYDNPQVAINKLDQMLEIELKVDNFDTTKKNTPTDLKQAIANYAELEARFANSEYLPMLYSA